MDMVTNGSHNGHDAMDTMTTHNHEQHGGHGMGMMSTASGHGQHGQPGSMGGHMAMGHSMFFTIGEKVTLLIQDFTVMEDDLGNFIAACVVIFLIAALYEGFKVFRESLLHRHPPNRGYEATDLEKRGSTAPLASDDYYSSGVTWCSGWHVLQSFLHVIQVTISYILMLLVMTFNVWIGLSVVLGAGFGYFIFAFKRKSTVDVNEHCH
ncbi:high affinity copper uptake protein 1-like isoform X2 [Anneissia japonica]|nr:high affinity copper uptake protein 1-like isoform X2 [Anneissia japonica]